MSDKPYKGRREDLRLLTGRGRYTTDHNLDGQAHCYFLRADRAHARIAKIDTAAAAKMPGVVAILTGEDIIAAGWKSPAAMAFFKGIGGSSLHDPFRPALAHGRVRFVGEPVVIVVANTEYQAQDAAEAITIDYEDLPALVEAADAFSDKAVLLHDNVPNNLAFDYVYGDADKTEQAFKGAAHIVKADLRAQRISGNPMEPKSCLARYDAAKDTYEVWLPSQGTSDLKTALAAMTGLDRERFMLHSHDVGGGFGVRNEIYPEFPAVMLAAKKAGRPVKWTGTRSETISGDHHGRAADLSGELALDASGNILGLRVQWLVNLGAYCSGAGPLINTVAAPTSSAISLYNVPAVYGRHRLVFTNTTPTTAYRGAGRPNVAYLWERLIERAAAKLGMDSVKLRRRNLLKAKQFPYKTPTGSSYDSADPAGLLDAALEHGDWKSFEKRRRAAKKQGLLRGIGVALFLEPSGGVGKEEVKIEITSDGRLAMYSLAGPSGQGHETVFPDVVAEILGLPSDRIELRYNDLAMPKLAGTGSFGSRSLISHGAALATGAKEIVRKGQELAAKDLEVAPQDITFKDGVYRVAGTDISVSLQSLIQKHQGPGEHPLTTSAGIATATAFPSGAHVAEVEIDPATGTVKIVTYLAVDDCGKIYNQTLVEAQLLGGLMQGVGQVLGEHIVYDTSSGQLLSGTFMDYVMPRADWLSQVTLMERPMISPANILGAKGAGEAGATGSIPALANAVLDALKPLHIDALEMPYSPGRVWAAIHANGSADTK